MSRALSMLWRRAWCLFAHVDREPVIHSRRVWHRCTRCGCEWGRP